MDIQQIKLKYGIIGNDPKLIQALSKAIQVAPTDLSIMVYGESGVGKEVFSRIIHDNSTRKHTRKGPGLVSVNCGALPEGTIESELFGHVKGAFTGADKDRKGCFLEADGGTIFLDEVGELPLNIQVKLLRVLENGEITRVGESIPQKVDVRVVAATNVNLEAAVRNGRFREDLFYRLQQIPIYIPPLRERKDDIPLLFRKFSSDVAERNHMPPIMLADDAREILMNYPWNGNIRELKHLTEYIAFTDPNRTITADILKTYLKPVPDEKMPALFAGGDSAENKLTDRELLYKALSMGKMIADMRNEINELKEFVSKLAGGIPVNGATAPVFHNDYPMLESSMNENTVHVITPDSSDSQHEEEFMESEVVEPEAEPLSLEDLEKRAIEQALARHHGRRTPTAQELKISERTLYRKIKDYGIEL